MIRQKKKNTYTDTQTHKGSKMNGYYSKSKPAHSGFDSNQLWYIVNSETDGDDVMLKCEAYARS